jgi:hypothetical protein
VLIAFYEFLEALESLEVTLASGEGRIREKLILSGVLHS